MVIKNWNHGWKWITERRNQKDMGKKHQEFISDSWEELKRFTDARIAMGRAGVSIPTAKLLSFQLAHAKARDSIYRELDCESLKKSLKQIKLDSILLNSNANNKITYLKNPELGRSLDEPSKKELKKLKISKPELSIILADGLSARAVEENSIPFIKELISILPKDWKLSPISIVTGGRVAVGDEVGEILKSKFSLILIGERPGLSSPNSLGAYLTINPRKGRKDSERNCISNIRPEGLSHKNAAKKAAYLLKKALELGLTGVNLKDDMENLLDSPKVKYLS
ncbi:MAG: ethanolamine ammonia-lyase subunit EutC, partial [Leptospiraceae bacterium]|nr:ethanolamine ammonia-lyase subunit EutC [Leptospiraceae bacterium]